MIVAIHQPQYLPWVGYFDKIDKADYFCFLDNVQFKKNEWQNRNRIKSAQGWQWITVPVRHRFLQTIKEVKINNTMNWTRKHLQSLIINYKKAPFFQKYSEFFEELYSKQWEFLSELNIYIIEQLCRLLGFETKSGLASSLDLREDPTDRLIDICNILNADTYLAGKDGIKYMDMARFKANNIKVAVQDFKHPCYTQLYDDFQSHLSIVDLLFNCGPDSMMKVRECNRELKSIW